MIELKGRTKTATVEPELGWTILELALKHDVDWNFSCTRGTCTRCRCLVTEGMEHLEPLNDVEYDALDDDEIDAGYRLGCQAKVIQHGSVSVANKPYF